MEKGIIFLSEFKNLIEPKLCMNCYWVVHYKMFTFGFLCGSESKTAATTGHCLSLDLMAYMKKKLLLSDLQQGGGILWALRYPPPIN